MEMLIYKASVLCNCNETEDVTADGVAACSFFSFLAFILNSNLLVAVIVSVAGLERINSWKFFFLLVFVCLSLS